MDDDYTPLNESAWQKFYHFLEDIWPSIYKLINSFLYGILNFIRFLISGLWPGK